MDVDWTLWWFGWTLAALKAGVVGVRGRFLRRGADWQRARARWRGEGKTFAFPRWLVVLYYCITLMLARTPHFSFSLCLVYAIVPRFGHSVMYLEGKLEKIVKHHLR